MVAPPDLLLQLPLVSSLVWFANGLWPWARGLRTSLEKAFVAGSLLVGLWTLLDWAVLRTGDLNVAAVLLRARITMLCLASLAFVYFGRWLTHPRGPVDVVAVVPVAATVGIVWTLLASGVEATSWGPLLVGDPVWYAVLVVQVAAYLTLAFVDIGRALRGATFTSRATRSKLVAIFAALMVAMVSWLATNVYSAFSTTGGFPGFSSLLIVPGVLVLLFLAPVSTSSLVALTRRLSISRARPFAAMWFHNSGRALAQLVLPGYPVPETAGFAGVWRALDHVLSTEFKSNPGSLRGFQHGDFAFVVEKGRGLTLAVLLRGRPSEGLRSEMRNAVRDFEGAHSDRLATWEGAEGLAETALTALDDVLSPRGP